MKFRIESLDDGPPELMAHAPFDLEVLRQIRGADRPDYYVGALDWPVRAMHRGRETAITHLVMCSRLVGERLFPGARGMAVNLAYVTDATLLDDAELDFGKCDLVAIGFSTGLAPGEPRLPRPDAAAVTPAPARATAPTGADTPREEPLPTQGEPGARGFIHRLLAILGLQREGHEWAERDAAEIDGDAKEAIAEAVIFAVQFDGETNQAEQDAAATVLKDLERAHHGHDPMTMAMLERADARVRTVLQAGSYRESPPDAAERVAIWFAREVARRLPHRATRVTLLHALRAVASHSGADPRRSEALLRAMQAGLELDSEA